MIPSKNPCTQAIVLAALAACAAFAQTSAFEVAVIKPTSMAHIQEQIQAKQRPHMGVSIDKARIDMGFQSLTNLIVRAYGISEFQIAGPAYLATEHFDIQAKMPDGATEQQVPAMLRTLLTDRFKMTLHRENRETSIYALVVGKSGLKMKPSDAAEAAPEPKAGDVTSDTAFGKMTMRMDAKNGMMMFGPGVGTMKSSMGSNGIHMEMSQLTMARLVGLLEESSDRVVVDKTGLKGSYQAAVDISMDAMTGSARAEDGQGGGAPTPAGINPLLKAVEQLGLKLEPQKDTVETLVIDHIEKTPSDN